MNVSIARRTLAASFLGAALALAPAVFAQSGPLDGKVFVGDAGMKGKEADEKGDVMTFAGGMFHSSSCDQYGYSKAPYKATVAGDVINFETETQSEKDGRLVWKGTVRGNDVEGTFIHYRKGWLLNPNPEPQEHWFKGKIKS
jgi:hypothetical protein